MEGSTLGPYTLEAELGAGGMGTVYRAIGPAGLVAVKVVHPHLLETPGFFKRFLREADIGRRVVHPNVVRTLDCDQVVVEGRATSFLVMECVEGQTLRELLDDLESVPEELCRHIGRELAKGLSAVHAVGAIHRDIKPENVLITPSHEVKLMDLGVARLVDEALRLSQTGAFFGSLQYAAPEQFQRGAKATDHRADLHALGLVLYELAGGICAYHGDDVPQIIRAVLHDEPRRLGDVNGQVSPFFEEVVHTLIAKDRDARFATADDVTRVLEAGEDGEWWRNAAQALRRTTKRPLRRIRIPRETAVYGRETELAALEELFARTRSGHGQVVLLDGEPGIGKSRLVDEFVDRLRRRGDDINFVFAAYPPGGAATASGAFSTAFREQIGDDGAAPYLAATPLLIDAFDALLRGDATPVDAQPLRKESLHSCFVNVTRRLAGERPTVILIDDLHFAPVEGLALFAALAAAIHDDRVLFIGTARPGISAEWNASLLRHEHATRMLLPRLGPKDLGALLQESFHSQSLAERLAFEIGAKSDGNPFFVFEIVRGLRDDALIRRDDDGSWISTGRIDHIQIPSSVLDLVHSRVADLDEEDKDLLEVASCCGYEFDPALVADAAGVPVVAALKRFGRIEKTHRLVRAAGRSLVFDHHQVQESLYSGVLEQLREHYHAALAESLERRERLADVDEAERDGARCVEVCDHFLRGAQGARAVPYLRAAIEHLATGYLNVEAIDLAERALAVRGLLRGTERARLLFDLARRLDSDGRIERHLAVATEAEECIRLSDDHALAAKVAAQLGRARFLSGNCVAAEPALLRGVERAQASGDPHAEGAVYDSLGTVLRQLARFDEAETVLRRALRVYGKAGVGSGVARAHGNLSLVLTDQGRAAEARKHLKSQIAVARECGARIIEANANLNLGGSYYRAGEFDTARSYAERYVELCRDVGDRLGETHACLGYGALTEAQGRLADALEQGTRALRLSRELAYPYGQRLAQQNIADVAAQLGDTEGARGMAHAAWTLARDTGDRRAALIARARLADLDAADGLLDAALGAHEDVLQERRDLEGLSALASSLIDVASHHLEMEHPERARSVLDDALELTASDDLESYRLSVQALAALLPGGDAAPALRTLAVYESRLPHFTHMSARFHLWRATADEEHLSVSRRLLDFAVEHAPPEHRETMLTNVPLHRDIVAAGPRE